MRPLARFLDPHTRQEYARHLLQHSANPLEPSPVAAFVFLLELVAWVQAHPLPATAADLHPGPSSVDTSDRHSLFPAASTGTQSHATRTGVPHPADAGASGQGHEPGADDDGPADWAAWREYLSEVYLPAPDVGGHDNPLSSAPSPLFLPDAIVSHLRSAISRSSFDPDTRSVLLSGCARSVLLYLALVPHGSAAPPPESDVDRMLDMLVAEARSPTFPPPLPSSTVSSIALSLAATRRSPETQRSEVVRQTLATLLGHYISPVSFEQSVEPGGHTGYASSAADAELTVDPFLSAPASSTVAAVSSTVSSVSDEDDDPDADTRSIAAGIRDAHASIARKDDKLRWLLGDNFQPGASPRTSSSGVASRSSPQPTRTRELSHESSASSLTAGSGSSSPAAAGKRHHRFTSSSSTTPLLNSSRPLSPTSRPFLHRRGFSAGSGLIHAASPSLPPLQHQASRNAGDIILPPQPFVDLAPAVPHVTVPSSSLAPPVSLSPRRTSLDSALDAHRARPMNCNNLSPDERRALVRRSKKLEGFFGSPFQEEAAARVLVDGQRDLVSPAAGAPALSPVASSSPSTAPSSRRASLAPPIASGHPFGPLASTSSSRLDARRPSALSLSSSQGSTAASAATSAAAAGRGPRSPRLHRSSSSPSRGRRSSSFSSLAEPAHSYFSERLARERARDEREERRRKLDKVRRVLGERVPLALIVPAARAGDRDAAEADEDGRDGPAPAAAVAADAGVPMGTSRSRGAVVGGMLRDKLKRGSTVPELEPEPRAATDPGWTYVEPRWEQAPKAERDDAGGRKGRQGVEALQKARKLENLFGDLPPPALFLSQASPGLHSPGAGPSSRPALPAARHRHSASDLSELAQSPFAPHAKAGSWRPSLAPGPVALRREATHCSADSYRQSIASLKYVIERDPRALDEVFRVYSAAQREAADAVGSSASPSATDDEGEAEEGAREAGEENEDEDEDEDEAEAEAAQDRAAGMQRSLSASSSRAVRQAQKLSNFFGTTHGEVWRMLLNDIEASIADDDSLDDDERTEVLAGVERLRQSASSRI